jgi:hypothetical protein
MGKKYLAWAMAAGAKSPRSNTRPGTGVLEQVTPDIQS